MPFAIFYAILSLGITEFVLHHDRKRGKTITFKQYCNLFALWPVCFYIAWKRKSKTK